MTERRFDAFALCRDRGSLTGSVRPRALPRLADRVDGDAGRIDWRIRGTQDEQGRAAIAVDIHGMVPLTCQRCLGPVEEVVAQETLLLLARDDAELAALDEVSEHEVVVASGRLDALELVEDELLLTLPFAPRHEGTCPAAP